MKSKGLKIALKVGFIVFLVTITLWGVFVTLVCTYILIPPAVPWVGDIIMSKPAKPKIKYGEFPFTLVYQVDEEVKTIEDTIICKFDGYTKYTGGGKYRKWKMSLKEGSLTEPGILLLEFPQGEILEYGEDKLEYELIGLYFMAGNAEYYMDDEDRRWVNSGQGVNEAQFMLEYRRDDGSVGYTEIHYDDAWERYKIRLISWEIEDPIENSFE